MGNLLHAPDDEKEGELKAPEGEGGENRRHTHTNYREAWLTMDMEALSV